MYCVPSLYVSKNDITSWSIWYSLDVGILPSLMCETSFTVSWDRYNSFIAIDNNPWRFICRHWEWCYFQLRTVSIVLSSKMILKFSISSNSKIGWGFPLHPTPFKEKIGKFSLVNKVQIYERKHQETHELYL